MTARLKDIVVPTVNKNCPEALLFLISYRNEKRQSYKKIRLPSKPTRIISVDVLRAS